MVLDSLRADERAQLHELYAELGRCKQWAELFEPRAVIRCVHDDGGHFVAHQFKGRDAGQGGGGPRVRHGAGCRDVGGPK
jgi:hypothetical protein